MFWSITASLAVDALHRRVKGNQALGAASVRVRSWRWWQASRWGALSGNIRWQFGFLLIGLCAAAVMGILAKTLPLPLSVNTGSLKSLAGIAQAQNLMPFYANRLHDYRPLYGIQLY